MIRTLKGTISHGSPEVVFRVKPTYILTERLDNFIVGHDLVSAVINGDWDKAETHRLGHENSEDALAPLAVASTTTGTERRSTSIWRAGTLATPACGPTFVSARRRSALGAAMWLSLECSSSTAAFGTRAS